MSEQEQQPPATAQEESSTDVSRAKVAIELTDLLLKSYLDLMKSGKATSQDRATAAMLLKKCGTLPTLQDLQKAKREPDALDDLVEQNRLKEGKQ